MRRALAVLSFAACAGAGLWAQQGITPEGGSPAEGKKGIPVTMTECEGKDNCATWTFLGAQGNGQWPSGETANLTVERYDEGSVVIRRADSTGASAGLTAVYTGTRTGDRVGGKVTSSWPVHWDSKTEYWYATVEKSPQGPARCHAVLRPGALRNPDVERGTLRRSL